jgi:protein-tyrosine phosphatase
MIWIFSNIIDRYLKKARKHRETDFTQITKNFIIGGRYSNKYMDEKLRDSVVGVVDLTNEVPELQFPNKKFYWNIQTWDGTAPDLKSMDSVANQVKSWYDENSESENSILIHCGYGRGRSTTFLVLLLCKLGIYSTHDDAFVAIHALRPSVKLNGEMRQTLGMQRLKQH